MKGIRAGNASGRRETASATQGNEPWPSKKGRAYFLARAYAFQRRHCKPKSAPQKQI